MIFSNLLEQLKKSEKQQHSPIVQVRYRLVSLLYLRARS